MKHRSQKQPEIQYRTVEVRALADGSPGFDGHASAFWVVDDYGTAIKPGAFTKTLQERGKKVVVLWQHDSWKPIGKPTELKEDQTGLAFKADVVTDTQAGAEAMALLRAEVPMGVSIGFQTIKSRRYEEADEQYLDFSVAPEWAKDPQEREWLRIIEEVKLWEFSLVTFPANEMADISNVRSLFERQSFPHLLASIKDGTLDDERSGLVEQLVAAWSTRAGAAAPQHSTPAAEARRDREAALQNIAAQCGMTVEQLLCVA